MQRYEGGSTVFGPFESVVLLSEFDKLVRALKDDTKVLDENVPSDLSNSQFSAFLPKLGTDVCPWLNCNNLGKVDTDVNSA